jgi:histidinol dehydrogenase
VKVERVEWDGRGAPALAKRMRSGVPALEKLTSDVSATIARVRAGGDAALHELAEKFGDTATEKLRVDPDALDAAPGLLEPEVRDALRTAAQNIAAVAKAERDAAPPAVADFDAGHRVEVRSEPVAAAGVYVPGGRASYPSSVLMCAVPAKVAGVRRIAVASPPGSSGRPSAVTLAACSIAGVDEVYAVGGAQAIAALAYGTESIAAVDVIAGPGNPYVNEAKRLVSGHVGIDGVAGPSELVVVADATSARSQWIALDVAAQAEHGEDSPVAVISPDTALLDEVQAAAEEISRERSTVSAAPLTLVEAPGIESALSLADAIAPEHLELAFAGADEIVARSRIAGCVFVGSRAGTAFGDYAAGSNHVLPTGGAARFGGPLGVGTFRRRTSIVTMTASAAAVLAPTVGALARAEGFPVHGESAEARDTQRDSNS